MKRAEGSIANRLPGRFPRADSTGLCSRFGVFLALTLVSACQCVQLPTDLKCTPEDCAPEACGKDGRCHPLIVDAGVIDAGCTPVMSCATEGRQCGLLQTGCGEEDCGTCTNGSTCGTVQPGQCAPCDLTVFDPPDPNFVDSNCDGIDGTIDGGLFVDPITGSDGPFGTGTRSAPVRSLARAQVMIQALGRPPHTVFIAEGSLAGVTWIDPVSLAGGYRSITWARSTLAVTTVRTAGVGLRLENVPATVAVSGLTIEGATATANTASVGLVLVDSPVKLQSLTVRAQDGAPGTDGDAGAPGPFGGPGAAGTTGESGPLTFCIWVPCTVVTAQPSPPADGGAGACGDGEEGQAPPSPADVTLRAADAVLVRPGLAGCDACPCTAADGGAEIRIGADGDGGAPGRDGDGGLTMSTFVATLGAVDGGWWSASARSPRGDDGVVGARGPGGRAGGSALYRFDNDYKQVSFGSVGGGGGAPGCAGRGGESGGAGAPSIGMIVVGAAPSFSGVNVVTSQGGRGGAAGAGGAGGLGGTGGPGGATHVATCSTTTSFDFTQPNQPPAGLRSGFHGGAGGPGGRGGNGGRGGDGAPGPGGANIGVWCERVLLDELPAVQLGTGGDGGVGPAGATAPDGRAIDFFNCR